MGHKKRNPDAALPPAAAAAAAAAGADLGSVKTECERALTALRRGNHNKALRLMKEAAARHGDVALLHRVHGTVSVKVAALIDDPAAKHRHLRNAVESARRAAALSPDSVVFAHFHASLLYEVAGDAAGYEEVLRECERGMGIASPVDPAEDSLLDDGLRRLGTAEARVAHVRHELQALVQKSNIASLSALMKNFGNGGGEEKFRLIPMRTFPDVVPMEPCRIVPARRPNEIKKATKTPEERRKEIEVRVAAARLLQQQKSESGQHSDEEEGKDGGFRVGSGGGGHRGGERRKSSSVRKVSTSGVDRTEQVRRHWSSMSLERRRGLLEVRVKDLQDHAGAPGTEGSALELLSEALSFAETNRTWKFWDCCRCEEKFVDSKLLLQHVVGAHIENLSPSLQSVLPQEVDREWTEMLVGGFWKPIDAFAAMRMFDSEPLLEKGHGDSSYCDMKDGWDEEWEAGEEPLMHSEPVEASSEVVLEAHDQDGEPGCVAEECQANGRVMGSHATQNWPLADDVERGKLLERIHGLFELLIREKYLAASHLNKIMQFSLDGIQSLASGSQLLDEGLGQSPICICFLDVSQLQKILKFLQELSLSCGVGRYPEKNSILEEKNGGSISSDVVEKIVFTNNSTCLLLDGRLLMHKVDAEEADDGCAYDDTISSVSWDLEDGKTDKDDLLSWLYDRRWSPVQLQRWSRQREEKNHQGMQVVQMLEKEFFLLQNLSERKSEHLSYEESLQAVELLCLEEFKRRDQSAISVSQSYETVLRKRQEELVEMDNDLLSVGIRFELDAISNILKEAQALSMTQFGCDESLGASSRLCDVECGEDEGWRIHDYHHQSDACIEGALQRQKEQLSVELSKIDARIMRSVATMQQLEHKLLPTMAFDYREVILPFMRSFIQTQLEYLVDKDATDRSDAAREAFLAELARDAKKNISKGGDQTKQVHEKSKDKKKNKENRKAKVLKLQGSGTHEHSIYQPSTKEEDVSELGGRQGSFDTRLSLEGLKLQELRLKTELEAEEKKLEEMLEYQRRIENETKRRHLAEQCKKGASSALESVTDRSYIASLKYCTNHSGLVDLHRGFSNGFLDSLVQKDCGSFASLDSFDSSPAHNGETQASKKQYVSSQVQSDIWSMTKYQKNPLESCVQEVVTVGKLNVENLEHGFSSPRKRVVRHGNKENFTKSQDGENGTIMHQQPRIVDNDEKFQADLEMAVQQSLDTLHVQQKIPHYEDTKASQTKSPKRENFQFVLHEDSVDMGDALGTGLQNEVGEYNCFLNVIIQSLWNLRRFRDEFLRRPKGIHQHVGDPCVVCALYDIFTALSMASVEAKGETIAPTSLRVALSNLYPECNFFQQAQMNDASEVLAVIFDCLHRACPSPSGASDAESESNCVGSWDCTNSMCIAHALFGMDIFEQMCCHNCGILSRHLKYTSFFHNINANALRKTKVACPDSSFDELLKNAEMNDQLPCDPDNGGCRKMNYVHHFLSNVPHVFTTVLGWQHTRERFEDISATLAAITTKIDVGVLYPGIDKGHFHSLVSVVCYYGQHYHCFAYNNNREQWVMYDDKTVKAIGSWEDVVSMCERGYLQPQVLLYEAIS